MESEDSKDRALLVFGGSGRFGGLVHGLGIVGAAHEAAGHADLGFAEIDDEDVAFQIDC